MSHIQNSIQKKPAYVGYLTAGDGGYEHSLKAIFALIKGGVDVLEIGVPFSDPVADGKTIQQASQRALESGMNLPKVFEMIKDVRAKTNIPIILFTYYNPIFAYGDKFYEELEKSGANGCLVVDLPLEEAHDHLKQCEKNHIDPIFLITPATEPKRIQALDQFGKGMLYYVCRNGTTGVKSSLPDNFENRIKEIKANSHLPVVTGFGISNKAMAKQVLDHADGFVIGSLFVDAASKTKDYNKLTHLVKSIDPRS